MPKSFRKLPPLNALTAFEAVARHRSFTKAASELFLTHSAVSQRVTQLEKHLRTRLFARSTRGVDLTPAGARYFESVRDALSKLALASDDVSENVRRQLRISVLPIFASYWLISRLPAFHRLHPNIDLDIHASTAPANLSSGEVDVAIRWGNGRWRGLEKVKLFSEELVAVCSKSYLTQIGTPRSAGDLKRAVLLRHSYQPWKPWFEKAALDWAEPTSGPVFNDSSLMLQAAVEGHGVALARRLLAKDLLDEGVLVRLFDVSAPVEDAFYVVFEAESLRRPEASAFVSWIKSAATNVNAADNTC